MSAPLLERAFYDTYGIKLTDVMPHEDLAINTYRRSISEIIPEMTKVALLVKGDELKQEIPNFNREKFLYHLSRSDYNRTWGTGYKQPGAGAYFMAAMFKVLPKVGPLRDLDFKEPTPQTENLYFKSVNQTVDKYGQALGEVKQGNLKTPNIDLDTGKPTELAEYPLADATYRGLLDEMSPGRFLQVDEDVRGNIVDFYEDGLPKAERVDNCVAARWRKTWVELNQARTAQLLAPENSGAVEKASAGNADVGSCGE